MSRGEGLDSRGSDPAPRAKSAGAKSRRTTPRRFAGGGQSLLAQGEPLVWLNGGALVVCVVMIIGLLALILYQGTKTFWPLPLIQLRTVTDNTLLGEIARIERYTVGFAEAEQLPAAVAERAFASLDPLLASKLQRVQQQGKWNEQVRASWQPALRSLQQSVEQTPAFADGDGAGRRALVDFLRGLTQLETADRLQAQVTERLASLAVESADQPSRARQVWQEWKAERDQWLGLPTPAEMLAQWRGDADVGTAVLAAQVMDLFCLDVEIRVRRRLMRTGNFELTGEHFTWVTDLELVPDSETRPEWAMIFERLAWGRFYGIPTSLNIDDQAVATQPAEIWERFNQLHPEVRQRWRRRRRLETIDTGKVNRLLEADRLKLREVELQYGTDSAEYQAAEAEIEARRKRLEEEFNLIRAEIDQLDAENARYKLVVQTASGQPHELLLADIVRCYPANRLDGWAKTGVYLDRWREFLTDSPREANSEGGVFPAIWGTVVMTLLMSIAVVPFGVLAALYLREYARAGWAISIVRIAVNNLAGVPSIVFGVFGLGFFCYFVGATIDQLFFEAKLPSPTFGTGGLLWASLTLALMTLPVVIVATEEALAAVPRSMREGSLACGATKWQTIRRIVLPKAMPGIMTGMILAMARGAGEVAPLMLVGAVKLAPELPLDSTFPFLHLERSFMHLGFHIYDLGFQSQNSEAAKPMVFTTTLLLICLIAAMNLIAIGLRSALRRRYQHSQF